MLPSFQLQKCMQTCNDVYQRLQDAQKQFIKATIVKHSVELNRIGGFTVIESFQKFEFLEGLKSINNVLEHKDAPKIISAFLADFKGIYNSNQHHLLDRCLQTQ